MREYIDIINEHNLSEAGAGPSRIITHIRNGSPFFMISAYRADKPLAENKKRSEVLKKNLASIGALSFIETSGEYHEVGQDKPTREESFFVLPRSETTNTDRFLALGKKLMSVFDQDSVILGDGEAINMYERDGSEYKIGDTVTFDPSVIDSLPGYSEVKGRKFSFLSPDAGKEIGSGYNDPEPEEDKWGLDFDKFKGASEDEPSHRDDFDKFKTNTMMGRSA